MVKSKMMLMAEARLGQPLEMIIPATFNEMGSLTETARELKIARSTLNLWMAKLGIQIETERRAVTN